LLPVISLFHALAEQKKEHNSSVAGIRKHALEHIFYSNNYTIAETGSQQKMIRDIASVFSVFAFFDKLLLLRRA